MGAGHPIDPSIKRDTAPPEIHEFVRGVIWNDDPAVKFFTDTATDNWAWSPGGGAAWFGLFTWAEHSNLSMTNIIGRSHFWDLQFLHAMGSSVGEDPLETLAKIMLWLEIMYKLSIGQGIKGTDTIESIPIISRFGTTEFKLGSFFTASSEPKKSDTLITLLTTNSPYTKLDMGRRALGSCMHLLQDSYAKGHTRRMLLNPGDLKPGSKIEFVDGKWAQLGDVQNFHSYKGQKHHDDYDQWNKAWPAMDPSKPDTFNPLFGARQAREKAVKLANFWQAKTNWEDGVKDWFLSDVFVLASDITPADSSV
jgi:hypothetical protein